MTGKILIKCDLVVRTGLHIGDSSSFSAIGTVDSTVIRDPFTGLPIVPGSSLKGKLRTLLARRSCVNGETLPDFSADGEVILRMFGGSEPVRFARLQFADAFLLNYDQLKGVGVTEVKSENVINRLTSKATHRQIERVIAGSRFGINIVYNLSDPKEMEEDLLLLSKAMKLLQLDYLGGHGSRGNGRVSFQNFQVIPYPETLNVDLDASAKPSKPRSKSMNYFLLKLAFDTAVHFGGSDSAVGSQSSALTLRADTIFSALCHTALEVYGEPALEELLVSADADALRISDAMPWRGNSFYLPKPIAASTSPAELSTVERKAVKKLAWIPASKFDRYTASLHSGTYPLDELDQSFGQAYEQTKASVTDGADAKPYFVGLYRLHAGCGLYVLCACEGTDQIKLLKDLFTLLGLSGIGGRTSAGYGRFHLDGDPSWLNTAEEESTRWMLQALERSTSPYLLLTSSLPAEEEMDAALEGASFQLVRRSGFAATKWVETPMKKQTQYFLAAGSVLQHPYQGKLYDVGTALPHPVYRYSKPLFMGVTL